MIIKKEITLPIEKRGTKIFAGSRAAMCMVMGTSAIADGPYYKITKVKGGYEVEIETLKERIKALEIRIQKETEYLDIMRQVVK